ncbi:hypothetical protein PsorP6_008942 [Peronosclerospora sorghi]|uniref:Uncharacterized protein n=1 Tax=Peronosclerospora sorghi TaxID=230839 RepID=A0ACC0W1K7_9STRA|nr:hypothetical protein PsorP6_008942 [Peronosclerospora sorghi]
MKSNVIHTNYMYLDKMTDRLSSVSVEEPEEEDAHRNNLSNGQCIALTVQSPPLKKTVAMQQPTNAKRVYPSLSTDSDAIADSNESSMMMSTIPNTASIYSEYSPRCNQDVRTALVDSQDNLNRNRHGMEPSLGYGTYGFVQPGQSILRMGASKISSGHGLKKSASVEFVLDHTHDQVAHNIYASTSSIGREPRRLTFEEKAELYRVRPDLEIESAPFYNDTLNCRNQRRIIFAMFGGMITIILMLVFFFWGENNK